MTYSMTCGIFDYLDSPTANVLASILLGNALFRVIHFAFEYWFRSSHYNTSPNVLLQIWKNFQPSPFLIVQMILLLNAITSWNVNLRLIIITFLLKTFDVYECPYDLIRFLRKGSGLDFASGMASSFFHGFLKIVLKEDVDGNSFKKRLGAYEDLHTVKFALKKLFILIPRSCCLQRQFEDEHISVRESLETKYVNRGGLKQRPYTVGVYGFNKQMKRNCDQDQSYFYVAAMTATPLITFHEFLEFNPAVVPYKTEVLKNFVKELRKLMSLDREIEKLVEIVEFDDDRDEAIVGLVLKRRIEYLWSQGY